MQSCNSIVSITDTTPSLWRTLRLAWCRHKDTVIVAKTATMPAHVVCKSCGWREPVAPKAPIGTRTWDSTRDEHRYEREKKRRVAVEEQKQEVIAQLAAPTPPKPIAPRRRRRSNVVDMQRVG
jgi:hypothetical protein